MERYLDIINTSDELALAAMLEEMQCKNPLECAQIASYIQGKANTFSRTLINIAINIKYECLEYPYRESYPIDLIYVDDIIQQIESIKCWKQMDEKTIPLPIAYLDSLVDFDMNDVNIEEQIKLLNIK